MENLSLTKKQKEDIFYEFILPDISKNLVSSQKPRAYILGGQPGAGKSNFIKVLLNKFGNLAIINGDDFRGYHPFYLKALKKSVIEASDIVQADINYWIEKSIEEVSTNKLPMVVEGTLKNALVPIKTANLLKERGYCVHLNVVLTNPKLSKVDILKRYILQKQVLGFARFTKIEAHNGVVEKIFDNILNISRQRVFDAIDIFSRNNDQYNLIYDFKKNGYNIVRMKKVLDAYKNSKLSSQDLEYIKKSKEFIKNSIAKYPEIELCYKNL